VHRCVAFDERSTETITEPELPFAGAVVLIVLGDALDIDGERIRSFASGLYDRPVLTERRGHQRILQLDLTPLGARRLLGVPMDELTNCVVPAEALIGAELIDRAGEAGDWDACWALVQDALARRLDDGPVPPPELAHAYDRIVQTHGRIRVESLARETGWSRRHLATLFRRDVGVTPKTLARIVRFEHARKLLGTGADLADVAFTCGFADQPHFTREFRDLAWTTPAALAA
jgi:AraC-like DNA-binding protein